MPGSYLQVQPARGFLKFPQTPHRQVIQLFSQGYEPRVRPKEPKNEAYLDKKRGKNSERME